MLGGHWDPLSRAAGAGHGDWGGLGGVARLPGVEGVRIAVYADLDWGDDEEGLLRRENRKQMDQDRGYCYSTTNA